LGCLDTDEKLGAPDTCNDQGGAHLQAAGTTAEEMGGSLEQRHDPSPFFLHGFEGDRRVRIEPEHRLVQHGHVGPASFLHPQRITGTVGVI
jgi:hypothetical protein